MVAALETVDDEADEYGGFRIFNSYLQDPFSFFLCIGIDMVKVPDGETAQEFGIMTVPTLAYFRRGTALIYEGDLLDPNQILGQEFIQIVDVLDLFRFSFGDILFYFSLVNIKWSIPACRRNRRGWLRSHDCNYTKAELNNF